MLRVDEETFSGVVETAPDRDGVPFGLVKSKIAIEYQFGGCGFCVPVDSRHCTGGVSGVAGVHHPNLNRNISAGVSVFRSDSDENGVNTACVTTHLVSIVEYSAV